MSGQAKHMHMPVIVCHVVILPWMHGSCPIPLSSVCSRPRITSRSDDPDGVIITASSSGLSHASNSQHGHSWFGWLTKTDNSRGDKLDGFMSDSQSRKPRNEHEEVQVGDRGQYNPLKLGL